jgi:hypothetical protein
MSDLSHFLQLLKPLAASLLFFDLSEVKLNWYMLKVNFLYSSELGEWRRSGVETEPAGNYYPEE